MKKILSILPLNENFSISQAGSASLFIKDNLKYSIHKHFIFGNTEFKDIINNNYKNIIFKKSFFFSKNLAYAKSIYHEICQKNFDLIEIYNRPQIAKFLLKQGLKNISIFFLNDPLNLRNSKTISDRKYLLSSCNKIYFISNWVKKRFFINLKIKPHLKTNIIYHGSDFNRKKIKKRKIILFVGKLNKSKGYDIFCKSLIPILNKFPKWKAYVIGSEPREKYNFYHKRLIHTGWLKHSDTLKYFEKSSITVMNSKWDEPFGRVAVEAASTGNVVILTNKGGLLETTKIKIILKKNSEQYLFSTLIKLIKNPNYLKKLQSKTKKFFSHKTKKIIINLDKLRNEINC